jgi:hypothetical protein
VVLVRLRKGSAGSPCSVLRFADELIARVTARRRPRREAVAGRLGVLEREADRAPGERRVVVFDQRTLAVLGSPTRSLRRHRRRAERSTATQTTAAQIAETDRPTGIG